MGTYQPPPDYEQLDGSAHAGGNCVPTSDAALLDRASQGAIKTNGAHIRALTGDTSGGLTLDQVRFVNQAYYGIASFQENDELWAVFTAKMKTRGAIVLVSYSVIAGTSHDCFRGNFRGNHALYVDGKNADGTWRVLDPGADGRYSGCPKGYQRYTDAFLKKAAGAFITGFTGPVIGLGHVQVLYSPQDQPAPVWNMSVTPPPPKKKTRFFVYTVINGVIDRRTVRGTGGFSAPCTPPIRFRWPAKSTTRRLVQIKKPSSRKGLWVDQKYAKEVK